MLEALRKISRSHVVIVAIAIAVTFALVTTQVRVWVATVVGRLRMDAEQRSARNRPEPRALAAVRMPDLGGGRVVWLKLLPVGDGVLALGEKEDGSAIVLLALDSKGNQRASTQIEHCVQADAVPIGPREAMVLCATENRAHLVGIGIDDAQLRQSLAGDVPMRCRTGCSLVSAAAGDEYSWLLPQGAGRRMLVTGRGLGKPEFAEVRGLSTFVTGMVPFGEGQVAVIHTDKVTELRLSLMSRDGTTIRSTRVTNGQEDFPGSGRAQVVSDGREIAVVWTRIRTRAWPLDSNESVLVLQRFGDRLQAMDAAQPLAADAHVVPVRAYGFAKGGMIAWDQGVRGSWETGSFVDFHSVSEIRHSAPRRTPSGRLPISVAQTTHKRFILISVGSPVQPSFETVIVAS